MQNRNTPIIGFIGAGNMAGAIINGIISAGFVSAGNIIIYDKMPEKCLQFRQRGVRTARDHSEFAEADYLFLAVKPYHVSAALKELSDSKINLNGKTIVSICAGVPIKFIEDCIGHALPVIRCMPSTPMLFGCGAVAVSANEIVDKRDFEYICRLFACVAEVVKLDESQMNDVIAVNGSSPAYVYLFVKAMLEGAKANGISEELALPLILKTVEGSCRMIRLSGKDIDTLIKDVCSPNGTTLAAMDKLYEGNLEQTVADAMTACTKRADEITAELK